MVFDAYGKSLGAGGHAQLAKEAVSRSELNRSKDWLERLSALLEHISLQSSGNGKLKT
jgi:hypothetical protein